jgi:hypothetical protein
MYDGIVTGYLVFDFDCFIHERLKPLKTKKKLKILKSFAKKHFIKSFQGIMNMRII